MTYTKKEFKRNKSNGFNEIRLKVYYSKKEQSLRIRHNFNKKGGKLLHVNQTRILFYRYFLYHFSLSRGKRYS